MGLKIDLKLEQHYARLMKKHGGNAIGMGWKNEEAQQIRFAQLVKLLPNKVPFSINDLGCGTGAFKRYLDFCAFRFDYTGYDVLNEMVVICNNTLKNNYSEFILIQNASEMKKADYSVSSGIFNLKYDLSRKDWKSHIFKTLRDMNSNSKLGFAFNALTSYSDKEFMKEELHYADPLELFHYCKTHFAQNVALLHDYNQYDFTIIVRKK